MSQRSPLLDLPFLQPAQAQKHVTHNEALRRLDLVVQLRLQSTEATLPPAAPTEGDIHAIGTGATGAWAGRDGMLGAWLDQTWQFLAPQTGWHGWDLSGDRPVFWDGAVWSTIQPELNNLEVVGIGTSADAINRLAVQSEATLLSHAGTGHQVKINKATTADTASLLFQSNWTGHAEMGLAGQDAFSIKVSSDGNSWTEALRLDQSSGKATGNAVQTHPDDATSGRLLTVGAFGLGQRALNSLISGIDALGTPAGLYRFQPSTPETDSLPLLLRNASGQIRIERYNPTLLRQTVWRNSFDGGIWTRVHKGDGWSNWRQVYDQATILGQVSEQAGQPSGAILERGSNVEGDYVRLADGTQICTRFFSTPAANHVWNFPLAFAAGTPTVIHAFARHATAPCIVTEAGDLSTTNVSLKVWDSTGAATDAPIHAMATGRWF